MAYGRVRLEVQFNSTEAALYAAGRQARRSLEARECQREIGTSP